MCVICYKPAGVDFPEVEALQNCFDTNSDGAGYMYAYKGKVYIRKGLMTFKGFKDSIDDLDPRIDRKKTPFVFHFRISTQAGIRKDCCHPYPLSKDMDELRKLKTMADFGIAHNGIISLTSEYSTKGKTPTYNDTMKFITDYLTLIIHDRYYYKNRDTISLIEKLAESKLAILDGTGHCELIGKFIKYKDCWYSNDSYDGWAKYYKGSKLYRPYGSTYDMYDYCYSYNGQTKKDKLFTDEEADYYLNEKTGLYEFNEYNCPLMMDDDPTYCQHCINCAWCEGVEPVPVDCHRLEEIIARLEKEYKEEQEADEEAKDYKAF